MKALCAPALLLAACNPTAGGGELASTFSPVPEAELAHAICRFDGPDGEAVFAAIPEAETGVSAIATYQRETLRLYNRGEALRLDGTPEEAVFGVEEYPNFDVALTLDPVAEDHYTGLLELQQGGSTFASADFAGACDG